MKSSWYLAQALLGLQRPQEAYDVAIEAYKASLAAKNIQTENLSRTVLRAKQAIWAAKETARIRELDETLASVEGLIEAEVERGVSELKARLEKGEIGDIGFREDEREIREDAERKVQRVREVFGIASEGKVVERVSSEVPFASCWWVVLMIWDRLCLIIWWMELRSRLCMTLLLHLLGPALTGLASPSTWSRPRSILSRGCR